MRDEQTSVLKVRLLFARTRVRDDRKEESKCIRQMRNKWWKKRIQERRETLEEGRIGDM